jgi:hypothetical protein
MVRKIVAEKKYDCTDLLGKFVDERHYDILVEEDCDVYAPADCEIGAQADCDRDCADCDTGTDERKIVFKFRKNFFTKEEQEMAYIGLREAATRTENRGLASGIKEGIVATDEGREWVTNYQDEMTSALLANRNASLDEIDVIDAIRSKYPRDVDKKMAGGAGKNNVWVISRYRDGKFDFEAWLDSIKPLNRTERADACEEVMKMMSLTTYGSAVNSGIAGWFDRYPRIPYGRATSYTANSFDKFKMSYPFLQSLARGFKELLPWRYNNQMEAAKKIDPAFLVPETPFTTVTVNKTFRTAAHYDAGDLNTGLSNLLTLSNDGNYTGGYLIAPEYRVAVNVRPGDLLLINNHEVMHGNTPIECAEGSERISLVVYFREKMLELGSKQYEDTRFNFVESRRLNQEHPLWKKLWNGVSEGMWESKEWYDYCETHLGRAELVKYHPLADAGTLEEFFG